MFNVKVWSIIVPIILLNIKYNDIISVVASDSVENNALLEGFVGCIYEDICQKNEICIKYSYFGKCVDPLYLDYITTHDVNTLNLQNIFTNQNNIIKLFIKTFGWKNLYVQCLVRTTLENAYKNLSMKDVESICGLKSHKENEEGTDSNTFSTDQVKTKHQNLVQFPIELQRDFMNTDEQSLSTNKNSDFSPENYQSGQDLRKIMERRIENLKSRTADFPHRYIADEYNPVKRNNEEFWKRDFPYHYPMYGYYSEEPVRSWIWVKFENRSLNSYEATEFLKELTNRLSLASPITQFYRREGGKVLFFNIPEMAGSTAEEVLQALKRKMAGFNEFRIENAGFGRTMPYQTQPKVAKKPTSSPKKFLLFQDPTNLSVNKPEQWKKFTTTLTVCLSILGAIIVLFLVYTIHYFGFKIKRDNNTETMMLKHQSNFGYTSVEDKKSGIVSRMKQLFGKTFSSDKPLIREETDHIITEGVHITTETMQTQPYSGSFEQRLNKDTSSSTLSGSENRDVKRSSLNSERGSISSWSSEPVTCAIDVRTGHLILSYLETYFRNPNRLATEWEIVQAYQSEEATPCVDAEKPENATRNRTNVPLPFEQSRVKLRNAENDYINASLLYDHNPRNPIYIATPGPLRETLGDFWQMIWEQSSVVLVCLERANELRECEQSDGLTDASVRYWPNSGTESFGKFEVHLVSEHKVCESYIVRSFYLKNLEIGETRTVTQFHYLTWIDDNLRTETKSVLGFRRKVNRSFRGMMSPIVVHCVDGCGRSGTYILLDLVLNRISRGIKEIDIAASLEHLRDQRPFMVQTQEQYEFVFAAVAQEVDAMLKTNSPTT